MRRIACFLSFVLLTGHAMAESATSPVAPPAPYFDTTGRDDAWDGGIRLIPIHTARGDFHVWTKRVGNNPRIKVLLLHGGPGGTHETFEWLDSYFPKEGVEYYYY